MLICKELNCPFWSEGRRDPETGSICGYGCQKYTVSQHCLASAVQGVTANQYALYIDEDKMNGLQKELIEYAIEKVGKPFEFEDIEE